MLCGYPYFALYTALLSLVLLHHACHARINNHCTSSCGNIHNITYPFRLNTDPSNCGKKKYELNCENNTDAVLYRKSEKYYVQAINQNNYTIRLAVADVFNKDDNCSSSSYGFPLRSTNFLYEYWGDVHFSYYNELALLNCANPVNLSYYWQTSPCNNATYYNSSSSSSHSKHYLYLISDYSRVEDVEDNCSIEQVLISSLFNSHSFGERDNISYVNLHDIVAYGFELHWDGGCCESGQNLCNMNDEYVYCYSERKWSDPILFDVKVFLDDLFQILVDLIFYHNSDYFEETISYLPTSARALFGKPMLNVVFVLLAILPILIVLYRVALFLCGVPLVITFLIYKWRRRHISMYDSIEEFLQSNEDLMPVRYSYSDIKKITQGFKDKLGEGGYGSVYKGKLRSGRLAAIKVLGKSKANGQEFMNEVATIGRIHHVNVVQLIGFCAEGSKRALIYEFMPNGSLDKYILFQESSMPISNEKMYEISLGVARGIEYLHQGCDMQILHFDIKPHNILLDENFNPKVSDFGLAKLYPTNNSIASLTAARGTMGYMAPELFYKSLGRTSHKADVYSFGMLLLEMVGRRKNLNALTEHLSKIYFPTWVYDQISKGHDIEVGNVTEEEKKITEKMIIVALWCIQLKPIDRPSMHKVVEMLEGDVENLQMPPEPLVSPYDMPQKDVRDQEQNVNIG